MSFKNISYDEYIKSSFAEKNDKIIPMTMSDAKTYHDLNVALQKLESLQGVNRPSIPSSIKAAWPNLNLYFNAYDLGNFENFIIVNKKYVFFYKTCSTEKLTQEFVDNIVGQFGEFLIENNIQ